ncbi:hypothetical protein SynRS9907_00536 [Synechococcus sp. RS9907]|nr:hypothetical protein SynRS9907_00536 [Synechococcus sp. RS9907]
MPDWRGKATVQSMNSNNSMRRATTVNKSTVAGLGSMERKARTPQRRHRLPRTIDISSILDSLEGARFGEILEGPI